MNFTFDNVDAYMVYNAINKQNVKKGPGPDEIPASILKATANIIAPHLSLILTICIAVTMLFTINNTSMGGRGNFNHYTI